MKLAENVYMKVIKEHLDFIQFIVIDLFCGAGGTTTGFEAAEHTEEDIWAYMDSIGIVAPEGKRYLYKTAKVVACVNHDPIAIESHWQNHPEVEHFLEDMRILDPYGRLHRLVEMYRAFYPHAKICVWASLECTNFSNAKGGLSRDEDSRTLAYELYHYVKALDPDYLFIENVVEFMAWGPMSPKVKKTAEGYNYCPLAYNKKKDKWGPHMVPDSKKNGQCWLDWRKEINSFGYHDDWKQINCADHGAITSRNRLFGCFAKDGLPIFWPIATHAKDPETSIIGNKLEKWNAVKEAIDFKDEGKSIFNRTLKDGTPKYLSPNTMERLYEGLIKHVAGGKHYFLSRYYSGSPEHRNHSVDEPSGVIPTNNRISLTSIHYLVKHYGGDAKDKSISVECPAATVTNKDHHSLQSVNFISKYNSNAGKNSHNSDSIEGPTGAIMTKDSHSKVQAEFFILNPSWFGNSGSIESPCHVVVARQDKAPLSLITCKSGVVAVPIYEDDCKWTVKIKEFMALYDIADIKMRMLKVSELKVIQGFPRNYILKGNTTVQKKHIGNAVHHIVPKRWVEHLRDRINNKQNLWTEKKEAAEI